MPISMFHDFAICGILYCDCLRRSETISLVTWSVGFSIYDSANIACLTLLITAFVCIRKYLYSKPGGLMSYIRLFVNVLGILFRQGSYKGFLLTAFSLWTYSVSLLFENALMSGLVVPNRNPVLDLAELINAGYRILSHFVYSSLIHHLLIFNRSNSHIQFIQITRVLLTRFKTFPIVIMT
jgi:hypothetical protein